MGDRVRGGEQRSPADDRHHSNPWLLHEVEELITSTGLGGHASWLTRSVPVWWCRGERVFAEGEGDMAQSTLVSYSSMDPVLLLSLCLLPFPTFELLYSTLEVLCFLQIFSEEKLEEPGPAAPGGMRNCHGPVLTDLSSHHVLHAGPSC